MFIANSFISVEIKFKAYWPRWEPRKKQLIVRLVSSNLALCIGKSCSLSALKLILISSLCPLRTLRTSVTCVIRYPRVINLLSPKLSSFNTSVQKNICSLTSEYSWRYLDRISSELLEDFFLSVRLSIHLLCFRFLSSTISLRLVSSLLLPSTVNVARKNCS